MANTLGPGQVRVGHIVDSFSESGEPLQAAALTFDDPTGPVLRVPFLLGQPQFAKQEMWFSDDSPPKTLLFADHRGIVTLIGVRSLGWNITYRASGRLGADVVVFEAPRRLKDEYRVLTLRSSMDGLQGFTDFRSVKYDPPRGNEPAVISFDNSETVTWRSQGFTYALKSDALWSGMAGRSFEARSAPLLSTTTSRGATPREHLRAQWAVRDLLLIAHGTRLAWRSHRLLDDQFPLVMIDNKTRYTNPVETLFHSTVEEHRLPLPADFTALSFPALNVKALGAAGLKRWTDLYANDTFRRAVQPLAEVINGIANFLEPQLMMLAIALDYFGFYRFGDGRRREMHKSIQKCLDDANLDWAEIGTRQGIALAITRVNNELKHPDRMRRPGTDELACITALATAIARAQIFDVLRVDDSLRQRFLSSNDGRQPSEMFRSCNLTISPDGSFVRGAA